MPSPSGTSTKPPAARTCGSAITSSRFWTGDHQKFSVASKIGFHSASGFVANTASSSAISAAAFFARSAGVAKRGSASHSGWPTARASGGQWRSPSRPTIQNQRPSRSA